MPVQGVNTNQVNQVVDATVNQVESTEAPAAVETPQEQPKVGDNWGGVVKESSTEASKDKNGFWNAGDNTGNAGIDAVLDKFASANAGNPEAVAAAEGAAAEIKENPQKFINPDGSVNKQAVADLITQKFASVSNVTVPSPGQVASENAQMQTGSTGGTSGAGATESPQHQTVAGETQQLQSSGITYKNLGALADADIMALAFIVIMEAAKSAREDLKAIMDSVKAINKEKEGWRQVSNTVNSMAAKGAGKNEDFDMGPVLEKGGKDGANVDKDNEKKKNLADKPAGAVAIEGTGEKATAYLNTPGPDGTTVQAGLQIGPPLTKKEVDNAKETVKNKLDSLSEMGEMESLRLQMAMDRLSKLMSTISNLLKKQSDTQQTMTQNIK